jgi:hypothetical protein
MQYTTTMAGNIITECQENYSAFLFVQKELIKRHFTWLSVNIVGKFLTCSGTLIVSGISYEVKITYSPFLPFRFDRIFLKNAGIRFNHKIHVYGDLSLCLYHPLIDMRHDKTIPILEMIPWITEWCINYQNWKKYGVWLGREILHDY